MLQKKPLFLKYHQVFPCGLNFYGRFSFTQKNGILRLKENKGMKIMEFPLLSIRE